MRVRQGDVILMNQPGHTRLSFFSFFLSPGRDFFLGLEACLSTGRLARLGLVFLSFIFSWWLYVPVHELLHALGCIVSGGTVSRLELSPVYGALFLRRIFPFVSSGSEYAGRLSGFETGGSDAVFLVTDFLPYLLTIFLGVPLLRSIRRGYASPLRKCIAFGAAVPIAYAPFMSVAGDYYEMGSIIVSRSAAAVMPAVRPERWRSDDLFRLADSLFLSEAGWSKQDLSAVVASVVLGVVLSFATYGAGAAWDALWRKIRQGLTPCL